jgi:hypothetical protein
MALPLRIIPSVFDEFVICALRMRLMTALVGIVVGRKQSEDVILQFSD